jgi:hypothetical protein
MLEFLVKGLPFRIRTDVNKKMDKQSDDPSPTKSDSSGNVRIMDPPGYIKPDLQDFLLTDITAERLQDIAYELEVDYVGPAAFPGTFPAMGSGVRTTDSWFHWSVALEQARMFLLSTSSF